MGQLVSTAVGGVNGMMSGAFANQKEGATDTGNSLMDPNAIATLQNKEMSAINSTGAYAGDATQQTQDNAMLGGLFGQGGTLDQTIGQETQQANQPWALTDEDKSAYGQISGDIARQFGQSDQSMSQALSDRGLSNSGVAGAAFSGAQGSKMEQLAGAQQKIANDRMKTNMQRLGQTQSFLSSLGNQANNAINSTEQRGIESQNSQNDAVKQQYGMSKGLLDSFQQQNNEALQQRQQTAHGSTLSNIAAGNAQGAMAGSMSGGGSGGGASSKT